MENAAPETKKGDSNFSYSEPLGLMAHLQRPSVKLDFVPVLDLLVIALLFGLLFTRFVMVPGMRVDLPDSEMQMQPSNLPVAVLTIGNNGMLFFDGSRYELDTIEDGFRHLVEEVPGREIVLLIKTQGSMDLQLFLRLCRMAQMAGFVQVQIAGEHLPETNSVLPGGEGVPESVDSGFLSVM
jgi:biopolymer transport protein ExbD